MCSDPQQVWYPQRSVCFASMEQAAAEAAYADQHSEKSGHAFHDGTFIKWGPKWTWDTPYPAGAGVKVYVAPVDEDPGDDFTQRHDAQPRALRAEQVDGDHYEADGQG